MMKEINFGLQGYRLLQAPNMTLVQMMSYIIQPPSGPVVVIDGGNTGDADYLRDEIMKRVGEVEAWIITHCHDDHYAALIEIMNNPGGVKINRIYYNFPPQEWINQTEPVYKVQTGKIFDLLHTYTDICTVVCEGDVIEPAGLKIEFLHDPAKVCNLIDPSTNNGYAVNDTSLVFRITFPNEKTALFLGDLGPYAGDMLAERYGKKLKSDIVQMAHHGQNGVNKNVYEYVQPEICLWSAPMWLYDNDLGRGFNTAKYKTVIVRGWMEELGVKVHVVEGEGPAIIY
jgi:beta-lactamase superfamily II metal-dependent hydrolase